MKILIIRHGEPDYIRDSLTEKGSREAEYLAEMLCEQLACLPEGVDMHFYVSPYGRAQATAAPTLRALGLTAETLTWLREFDQNKIKRPDKVFKKVPWDWLPQDWTADPRFYDKDEWSENEVMKAAKVGEAYREVTESFDALLAQHGYRREGGYYRVEKASHDVLILFCHFGVESVLLSHIFEVSPMTIWHHSCAAPASVTTLVTEERRKGIATFRMLAYGETAHLKAHGEEPSFAARFSECYEDNTRHD